MNIAMLYHVFLCWVVTLMALLVARHINSLEGIDFADKAYALFWALMALLWLFAGLRQLAHFFGYSQVDRQLFYLVNVFTAAHVIPAGYFVSMRAFKRRRIAVLITSTIAAFCLIFLVLLLYDGIQTTLYSPWATEHEISSRSFRMFLVTYVMFIMLLVYDLLKRLFRYLLRGTASKRAAVASGALLLYSSAGIFDVQGVLVDHMLLIQRAVYMLSVFAAFTAYSWQSSSIRIVHVSPAEEA